MESTRKLLEGERVEVRQKEMGLRGSWHSGVIIEVRNGRRVVEYDELFTLDGSKKLREIIPLREEFNVHYSAVRDSSSVPVEPNTRGFIRPIPPRCSLSSSQIGRKGFLVDAFYDCAWWEGILLHDTFKKKEASKVNIFFPDEGDELTCFVKDVRVSQEWDEVSGEWVVRGIWPLCDNDGEFDLDHLKIICKKQNSSIKKLWRQRNGCEQALLAAKKKNSVVLPLKILGNTRFNFTTSRENGDGQKSSSGRENKQSKKICTLQETDAASKSLEPGREKKNSMGGAFFVKHSASTTSSLVKSRFAAKKFLLDLGWKIMVRTRKQGVSQGMRENIYAAPHGAKYYSLAAACRSWRKMENLSGTLEEGISRRSSLLDVYNLAELLRSTGKRLKKAKVGGHLGESYKIKSCEGRKLKGLFNSIGKSARGSGRQSGDSNLLLHNNYGKRSKATCCPRKAKKRKCSEEQTEQKCKSEKTKKRKCNEEETEQKCKKSRCFMKNEISLLEGPASHSRGGCRMQVLLSSPHSSLSAPNRIESIHVKRSTVLSWLIDKGIIKDNEPVCYVSRKDGHVMKKGEVTREGVYCKCCEVVFTLSNFEAHAGSKLHRPSANIFLDDGRSITDCQLQACALQEAKEDCLADVSDDTCGVCAEGGELILCDHCPSTFHPNCIGLEIIPDGDWSCPRCLCGGCKQDKMASDDSNTLFRCDQCELGYHPICAPESVALKPVRGAWFCGCKCEQLFTNLRNLVGKASCSEDGFSWMLLRSKKNDLGLSLSSVELMAEHNVKLGVAHDVMQECFMPMVDPRTKINLISQALYNRKSKVLRLNYGGFYTVILERGDEMISVATIRVHGYRLAEMPLVGTRYQYRRQGMCRRLMQAIEQMLGNIGVEKLVLPAVPELLETWTTAFNYHHLTLSEMHELSRFSLMTFPGTTFLQKKLKEEQSAAVLISPGNVIDYNSLTCKSTGDLLVGAGAVLDVCDSDTRMPRDPSQSNLSIIEDMIPLNESLNVEGFLSPPPLTLESLQSAQVPTESLWSNSLCDQSNDEMEKKLDGVQYARVVRATTRSKRLVKSSKWIADGLKELAKDSDDPICKLNMVDSLSETMTDLQSVPSTTARAQSDLEMAHLNLESSDGALKFCNTSNSPKDGPLRDFLAEATFAGCPNYYVRRRKTEQLKAEIDFPFPLCEVPSPTVA